MQTSMVRWDNESKKVLMKIISLCIDEINDRNLNGKKKQAKKNIKKALELFTVKRIKHHYQLRVGGNKKINLDVEIKKALGGSNERA